jgi:hypothetical protein
MSLVRMGGVGASVGVSITTAAHLGSIGVKRIGGMPCLTDDDNATGCAEAALLPPVGRSPTGQAHTIDAVTLTQLRTGRNKEGRQVQSPAVICSILIR